ncbi:NAD(P)-dependent alcohol dehydrogenase [Pararhizobium sp. IMCC21322]|uniref:NAD(P)-dependent alcohol dehydrogenase n=1 Tax=Pararhizobium sp. IMCC21322 TaxID=3067903 RepID=UPI002740A56E|nr:NAD(P)-dependent alcohol dehydrogenase [Pararhizobium sp. IMCC21322]
MKAVIYKQYGAPDVLKLSQVTKPTPKDNEVLIKIYATSVTTGDQKARSLDLPRGYGLIGRLVFGTFAPRRKILGTEYAGRIVAVGQSVTRFKIGDDVFAYPGAKFGGYAEYATIAEGAAIALMPASSSYKEAAGLSFGGATALNFLRDKAGIQSGDKVLINGASGGVGTAAVQIAKYFGAHVSGVCSAGNMDLVRSIGADSVIDYTQEDFSWQENAYDIILDTTGTLTYKSAQKALRTGGRFLMVSGDLPQLLSMIFATKTDGKKGIGGYAPEKAEELKFIAELVEAGQFSPVIDRCYPLDQIQKAHAYVDTGRKKGNVIISVDDGI